MSPSIGAFGKPLAISPFSSIRELPAAGLRRSPRHFGSELARGPASDSIFESDFGRPFCSLSSAVRPYILPAISAAFLFVLPSARAGDDSVTVANPPPPAFTQDMPGFLYFKEGTVTRSGPKTLDFHLVMDDSLPSDARRQQLKIRVNFDIDNDGSTGRVPKRFPGFGLDLSVNLIKERNVSRWGFTTDTDGFRGLASVAVRGFSFQEDVIEFQIESPSFSTFPVSRLLVLSAHTLHERGTDTETWVDQWPRKGAITLKTAPATVGASLGL